MGEILEIKIQTQELINHMETGAEAVGLNKTLDMAKIKTLSIDCIYSGRRKTENEGLRAWEGRPRTRTPRPGAGS